MTLDELKVELNELVQKTVTFKRIAGNSIIIYFFGEPGDEGISSIFLDPSWRYQLNGRIIVGSYDLQLDANNFNSKQEYEERFDYLCSLTDPIKGSDLVDYNIDLDSSDLTLVFS